jgi:hypothetical protein
MSSTTTTGLRGWRRAFTATALAVALPAAMVLAGPTPASANAPDTAGSPNAPVSLFTENFENGVSNQVVSLDDYTGATPLNETYTADPAWLSFASCNGLILSEQDPAAQPPGTDCGGGYWALALAMGAALGSWEGADPSTNHVLVGYTAGDPGPGVELQTDTPIPLPSANRFLTVRANAAAQNCGSTHPLYVFSVLNGSTVLPAFSSAIDPCNGSQGNIDNTAVGTYTGNQAVLFPGTAAGIQLYNQQGSGGGNDGALDNIQLLDVTPQLDLSSTLGATPVGASANLTFTITNTTELDAKNGWSFTANLPTGLTAADNAYTTTCASATAAPGSAAGTINVGGNLSAGQASCTVTVHVTSIYGGSYQLCAAQITNAVGVNLPGCTTLTFTAPVFDARADSAQLTSLLLNLGPLVPSAYECVSVPGSTSDGALDAGLGAVGSLGALNTAASGTIAANGARTAAASSQTSNISLLGGLISADAVVTTAQARQPLTASGPGQVTLSGSTTFTNLRVAGAAIVADPGPNTTIGLPGVGAVILNEQTSVAGGDGITVTALDLTLLAGTHLTISQSTAALLSTIATCPVS